ncbi:MAG TPA: DUF2807 domain-containing protein [Stellaceae bacterium]|nr:DUF2807 domain-containing protein [Stellaceae bacterium]
MRLGRFALGALAISAVSFGIAGSLADWTVLDALGPRAALGGLGCRAMRLVTGDDAKSGTRTLPLPWTGSSTMEINLPATIFFEPGPSPQASVTGDPDLIEHLRFEGGRLAWKGGFPCSSVGALTLHISGPAPAAWRVNGAGSLTLSHLQQQTLAIAIRGSGKVVAEGMVQSLTLDVAGSARADLRALAARQVRAHIRGSANADIAPSEDADLTVAGSALVTVHGHPEHMRSRVAGSSEIRQEP